VGLSLREMSHPEIFAVYFFYPVKRRICYDPVSMSSSVLLSVLLIFSLFDI